MGKGRMSIGDDTLTGEPDNGPKGPYITDKDDGTRSPQPGPAKDNGREEPGKRPLPTRTETEITRRSELGSDEAGG
jgi:hypothetical protein